jgi:hypothetical protein
MKKYLWLIGMILVAVSAGAFGLLFAQSGPIQAGVAAAVKGEVKSTQEGAQPQTLKSGDKVYMGDVIETGKSGQLQVLLLDQTVFTLGPLSALKVDEFVYDPKTDDGKVKANVLKGIFRVVSGKVAHKKPENMEVALPAGTIGFRGTNVAGIIDGAKSLVVLLGPVGTGRISVSNIVNGEVIEVDIDEAGNATIVGGPNIAPVPVFQVSEADLKRIANALGQQMSGGEAETTGLGSGTGGTPVTNNLDAQALLKLLSATEDLSQQSQDAAQDIADTKAESSKKEDSGSQSGSGSGTKFSVGA